jgi:hypothetical protein
MAVSSHGMALVAMRSSSSLAGPKMPSSSGMGCEEQGG